ncbi:hypothetical protein [Nocardioides zeae]
MTTEEYAQRIARDAITALEANGYTLTRRRFRLPLLARLLGRA